MLAKIIMGFSTAPDLAEALERSLPLKLGIRYYCPYQRRSIEFGSISDSSLILANCFAIKEVKVKWFCSRELTRAEVNTISSLIRRHVLRDLTRQSILFWRASMDAIPLPHIIVDNQFRIIKANRAAANQMKLSVTEIKGLSCHQRLAGRDSPCVGCPILGSKQTPIQLSSGSFIPHLTKVDDRTWSIYYEDERLRSASLATFSQRYKLFMLEKTFQKYVDRIDSHIKRLKTQVELLPETPDTQTLRRSYRRAESILQNLTHFLHPEDSSDTAPWSLPEVTNTMIQLIRPQLANIQVKVSVEHPSKVTPPGSASAWEQIIFNLISNACNAMPTGGSLFIDISPGQFVLWDSGHGIHPDDIKRVQQPLFTTRAQKGGSGLGLWIVHHLVNRLKMQWNLDSQLGKGTAIIIWWNYP